MSHQTRLHVFSAFLIAIVLISSVGNVIVSAAPVEAVASSATPTLMLDPTATPTPGVQANAKPQAWVDGTIDLDQFPPQGNLVVRFNTPMLPESSPQPVLSWPALEGVSSWDASRTVLTFDPAASLDSKKTYTFFLDSSLRSAHAAVLENAPEWIVHVQSGPKILSVSPEPGSLEQRYRVIEVRFNREMNESASDELLSIEPPVPFDLKWKNEHVLQITLEQPLEPDRRYDFTLRGGNREQAVLAADGTYLAEDYRWFYWQRPFEVQVEALEKNSIGVKFSYALNQKKSGIPFTISPALEGEWKWSSAQEIRFTAHEPIPASQEYALTLTHALVDANGFEIASIPSISFSGLPPLRLVNSQISKSEYSDTLVAEADLEAIEVQFDVPVDHASAEKAFTVDPALPGKFQWTKKGADASREVLVYALAELLTPSTTYTVRIAPSVLDRQGNKLIVQPYVLSFAAASWSYLSPSFGESGANVQVVDANGPRRLQFGGGGDQTSFAAYPFDLIDFAKLYANHYHRRHWGNTVRDIPIPADLAPAAVWTNIASREVGDGWVVETTLPPDLAPGLYVLNLRNNNVMYDQLFLVVTRNTLVVKHDGDELFVWLTDINGASVPEAEVRVYSANGEKVREGKTDENGQYRVSIPTDREPVLVSARINEPGLSGDVALAGFDSWYSYFPYVYGDTSDFLPYGEPYLAYIYTERPLYRPGQVVNFKAILRKDNDVRYQVPEAGTPVRVRVLDARGNAIETLELLTNRFGSVHGTVPISEGALLGDYQIETEVEGVLTYRTFKVEDYRKPDYQIKLTSLQPEKEDKFVLGEEISIRVNAAYYFGEPLANTNLEVHFYRVWPVETRVSGSLTTDENGETTLTFSAPFEPGSDSYSGWEGDPQPQIIRMEVTANDGSNQTVTGVYRFWVYPASEQLKLETGGYYVQPGQAFSVTATALDLLDQPIPSRKLSLTTSAWNRETFDFDRPEQTFELQTDANGTARQEIQLSAGYHQLTLRGEDPQGHTVEVSRWVYVFRTKEDWFERGRDGLLSISAEKDSYKPYDTARFAIESTFSGPALLTFERGSVINTRMVELTAPLTLVETEIIPEHAPNVYVTVNAWQAGSDDLGRYGSWYYTETAADSYLRLAKTQIQVDMTAKALDIQITTDKQIYQPGETLSAVIEVRDAAGKPVLAELSLAVVDEAIYGLASDFAGDIFDEFYGPRAHSVTTFDSMSPHRIIFEGGRGGGGGDGIPRAARSEFLDTSAWLPVIETDANGQATVTVDLPDNTTSWRLSVKAITLNHQVGQTETNVETKKDVFVRPVLPRVLTNGDEATLTAFIHNYSPDLQTVTVNLSAPGLEILSQNDEQITVQPGKVRPVGWRVRVQSAKPTQVTMTLRSAGGVLDAVLLPLVLQPAAVKDVQNQSGQFTGTLTLALPLPEVERETSQVRLTLNRSMSGTLLNGLEYLTGYPYGCVEQTMSRALPNAVVGRAASQLGVGGPEMQARLDPLIKASIQRLYGLQHEDGGWGWWTDDVSDAYQTAWVLFGLGVMDRSGYPIEPQVMDSAADWLRSNTLNDHELDLRTSAYALYSMAQAGRGDLEKTKALVATSIYELDPFSQAALALALHHLGEKEDAQAILNILAESALKEAEYVYWPQPSYDGEYHSKTMASSVRTTALVLLAYAEIEPGNELMPGIVNYLADQRQGLYGWGTTNETSFTILGLTGYLVREQNKAGSTPYEVLVNGKSLISGTLEVGHSSASLDIPLSELKDGLNTLEVTTQGENPVYFDLSTRYDLLQREVEAAGNIRVTRRYLDPETKDPIEQLQAGQLVKVEVRVNVPEDVFFLAVEDYLPGGLEALNEGLSATNQVNMDTWGYEEYRPFYWQEYGYNYKEIRGDRVVFFITNFEKGARTFTYYARVTTSGQFTVLPAQAYAMYDLSLWGRSESNNIQISK